MTPRRSGTVSFLVLLAALAAAPAVGQVQFTSDAISIDVTGRVHAQWNTSSVNGADAMEFEIRRARMTFEIGIDDFISGKIQPDFGRGGISLKDAYVQFNFHPAFNVLMGQMKRPFDLFELLSSTQIVVIERTGAIRGASGCLGPGGTCSWSRLTESLDYSDRDIGVRFQGRPSERVEYFASITNGTGANTPDENGAKSYTGRVVLHGTTNVRFAANVGVHDYLTAGGDTQYAGALGGDVELGEFNGAGPHFQAGVLYGGNWRNLDAAGDPSTFITAQTIISYNAMVEGGAGHVRGVEPLLRISYADPDTGAPSAEALLFTPGVAFHFTGRNMFVMNVDVWDPGVGSTEWSVKFQSFLHF